MSKKEITLLGLDFGEKNIGVAVGQTLTHSSKPLTIIRNHRGKINWDAITTLIQEWKPNALILGWPLNMDGSESEFCARVKKFSRQLEGRYNLPVHLTDERLSSAIVKAEMSEQRGSKHNNYKQNPIDNEAAAVILQSWLNESTKPPQL